MDVYKIIQERPPVIEYQDISKSVYSLHILGAAIYEDKDKLFKHFFGEGSPNIYGKLDEFIVPLYKSMGEGIIIFHQLFEDCNIGVGNLNDYLDHIINEQGLSDSEYYTDNDYIGKLIKLIKYSIMGSEVSPGYKGLSNKYPPMSISHGVFNNCHKPTLQMLMYLTSAKTILTDPSVENKTEGQGLLIEAFMMWLKIANIIGIDIEIAIEEAYATS